MLHDEQHPPLCVCPPAVPQALGLFTDTPPSTLKTFFTFFAPQDGHAGAGSRWERNSFSNFLPHFSQTNSYIGICASGNW